MPDELARFCAELSSLREALRDRPRLRALLDEAERAARGGRPAAPLLAQIGIAVGEGDSTWVGRGSSYPMPAPQHVVPGVYLCPVGACARVDVRAPGDAVPTCHLHDRALRFAPDGDG